MFKNLDMDCLRTFVALIELGSYAEVSRRIECTEPAIRLQIRRLEEKLGVTLFQRASRRVIASPEGEQLLRTALNILQMNDAIVGEFEYRRLSGKVSLGVIQDLADTMLPETITWFARNHPKVRLTVKVDRTHVLTKGVETKAGEKEALDFAIGVHGWSTTIKDCAILCQKMIWIGCDVMYLEPDACVPLVVFEEPCSFRETAIDALNKAGKKFHIVYTSPSLLGLKVAVQAGLGITARTPIFTSSGVKAMPESAGLPELPDIKFGLYQRSELSDAASRLKDRIVKVIADR